MVNRFFLFMYVSSSSPIQPSEMENPIQEIGYAVNSINNSRSILAMGQNLKHTCMANLVPFLACRFVRNYIFLCSNNNLRNFFSLLHTKNICFLQFKPYFR